MPIIENLLGLVMFTWDNESFKKLSVMSPNTIHTKGSTTPWAMDITVPKTSNTMSKQFANLNYTHIKERVWKQQRKNSRN